jgi:type II secretory pathway pseudopilin PulG
MPARHPTGWTLFELLVVVGILAIIGAALLFQSPRIQQTQKLELGAAEAASALRFAQSEAVRTGSPHGARISTADNRIRVYRLDTSGAPFVEQFDVYHPLDKRLYEFSPATSSFATGLKITLSDFQFAGDAGVYESVAFSDSGLPVSPVDLAVLTQGSVDVTTGSATMTVTLQPGTGRATVQ